jgi:hypothetical protein
MAGKVTTMSKIKQLIHLHESGVSNRKISKMLCLDRSTVNSYVKKLPITGLSSKDLLSLDDPILEGKFTAGTSAFTDSRYDEFKQLLPDFERELKRKHVTRYLLWREYLEKYPDGYKYTQFCYHLNQQLLARVPSAVLDFTAGEKMFVDFAGDKLEYIDRESGEVILKRSIMPICALRTTVISI